MSRGSEEGAVDNLRAKLEGRERGNDEGEVARMGAVAMFPNPGSSRQWSAFRNPRIVRASRAFGGKDRHSKVCTVRGLRDRRIRLSVPTAVQVYDLQDKLGLGQPSKVMDWLMDASREDIDRLPPLQLPKGFGPHHFDPRRTLVPGFREAGSRFSSDGMLGHGQFLERRHGVEINEGSSVDRREGGSDECESLTCATHLHLGGDTMTRGPLSVMAGRDSGKGKWVKTSEGQGNGRVTDGTNPSSSSRQEHPSAQNFFPIVGYSLGGFPYSGYGPQWEPSGLSLTHFVSHGIHLPSESPLVGSNAAPEAAPPPTPQLYYCPPPAATPLFPQYPRHTGHHHLRTPGPLVPSSLNSIVSAARPPQASLAARYLHPEEDRDNSDVHDEDGNRR